MNKLNTLQTKFDIIKKKNKHIKHRIAVVGENWGERSFGTKYLVYLVTCFTAGSDVPAYMYASIVSTVFAIIS